MTGWTANRRARSVFVAAQCASLRVGGFLGCRTLRFQGCGFCHRASCTRAEAAKLGRLKSPGIILLRARLKTRANYFRMITFTKADHPAQRSKRRWGANYRRICALSQFQAPRQLSAKPFSFISLYKVKNNSHGMTSLQKKWGGGVPWRSSHAKPPFRPEATHNQRTLHSAGGGS